MAASSALSPPLKNYYSLRNFACLLFSLVTLLLISWENLQPQLSLYSYLTSSSRSIEIPIASTSPHPDDDNATALLNKDGDKVPISSESNLEEKPSSDDASRSNLGGNTFEKSANASINETSDFEAPGFSKSDSPDENNEEQASVDSKDSTLTQKFSSESGNEDRSEKDPSHSPSNENVQEVGSVSWRDVSDSISWKTCDVYKGNWVKDEEYPLYKPGSCPYVDEAFDCQNNGRPDSEYLKWRWKPDGCDLPRFNATDFLVRLRGKRLMLVGDSMNRNQFESLLCLLHEGLQNKSKMYEVHGYKITKGRGYYIFKFEDYNCSVEFVRSHFLVKEGIRINRQGNSNPTLSIDRIDKSAGRWQRADILVFNTGHWWTHGKTARGGGDWDSGGSCTKETEPVLSGSILDSYPLKMKIAEDIIKDMQVSVVLLNVTKLTNFRKDGHPSVYGKKIADGQKVSGKRQDCSHWCLPGVPDAWNELIYATLVAKQTSSSTD
ncbi:OLC1v1035099C3 [Oldenlandia corymbosa var. corymbosa]|uniref:OLC1v1035099C3 n=1 Tax=Oldenlandia corymbosa var. corymbosa TaxID=529605 RepID=A0AAV1CSQ9_OLDCO|nr:OLC1v1035099C3 [Oldenlandia corymbosa var. corymbosa]